jgi:ribosomal protein S18 acetylase RimI-like enzyme
VGVARDGKILAGVVSGTLDTRALKKKALRALGFGGAVRMAGRTLIKPGALLAMVHEMKSRPPTKIGDQEVKACLTAIAVASSHRRMGLATKLTRALEEFFRAKGVKYYWLETVVENSGARAFYLEQGFEEMASHGGVVRFMKRTID